MIHRARPQLAILAAGVLVALGTAACSRSDERGAAIDRLREVDRLLADVDQAYRAGKAAEARELATKVHKRFDESPAERVLSIKDPLLKNQLESILEAGLRDKLAVNAPVGEVAELIARTHELVKRAIDVVSR